jgi:GntR family transcriptional repressor for pyruvate dehydrogenase complex
MFKTASKSEKVSDKIIHQIRNAILSGQLMPGDKLASEKELMEQFEVSKATMREALRVLEVLGLIEIRKGTAGGLLWLRWT